MSCQVKFVARIVQLITLYHLLMGNSVAQSGSAILRFSCDGTNANTEIYIDGKLKGECPLDTQVAEGVRNVRYYKRVDHQHEQSTQFELKIGADTVKRMAIELKPQLTTEARREKETSFLADLNGAKSGDGHAQFRMAQRYRYGNAVDP